MLDLAEGLVDTERWLLMHMEAITKISGPQCKISTRLLATEFEAVDPIHFLWAYFP
jgi:hypothetical protein